MANSRPIKEIMKEILHHACKLYADEKAIYDAEQKLMEAKIAVFVAEKNHKQSNLSQENQQKAAIALAAAVQHQAGMQAEVDKLKVFGEAYLRYQERDKECGYSEYEQKYLWDSSFPEFKSDEDEQMYHRFYNAHYMKYQSNYETFAKYDVAVKELYANLVRNPSENRIFSEDHSSITFRWCGDNLYEDTIDKLAGRGENHCREKSVAEFRTVMVSVLNNRFNKAYQDQNNLKKEKTNELISKLNTYIERIGHPKNDKNEINFANGFLNLPFFSPASRALNRRANYELAQYLHAEVQKEHVEIESLFSKVSDKRSELIKSLGIDNNPDYVERGINSRELNKILDLVRDYAADKGNKIKI